MSAGETGHLTLRSLLLSRCNLIRFSVESCSQIKPPLTFSVNKVTFLTGSLNFQSESQKFLWSVICVGWWCGGSRTIRAKYLPRSFRISG